MMSEMKKLLSIFNEAATLSESVRHLDPPKKQIDEGSNTDPTVLDNNQRHAMLQLVHAITAIVNDDSVESDMWEAVDQEAMEDEAVQNALAYLRQATTRRLVGA